MRVIGHYDSLGNPPYFIPHPLPPVAPSFVLDDASLTLYGEAMLQIGELNGIVRNLVDRERFLRAYVIKEALLSSSIEGIHTTLLDVFTQPLAGYKPDKETQLVLNYGTALATACHMITKEGLPIANRVLMAAHRALMQAGAGEQADPGQYRKQPVRVGTLIPAPPHKVPELMTALEQYINTDAALPPLVRAGLAHVQFEMIHPFLDGNGRIGRLLIVLMLFQAGVLIEPVLYPSYYLKKHQFEYYQQLDRVRTHGDFEGWIKFYITAIRDSAMDAYRRAHDIKALHERLAHDIAMQTKSMPMRAMRLQTLQLLFQYPVVSVLEVRVRLKVSYNTADRIIKDLVNIGTLAEVTQQKRGKLFQFAPYIALLEQQY